MKKINPKKLLPAPVAKNQSSFSQKLLVPASKVTVNDSAKVQDNISTPQQKELKEQSLSLKRKFISLTKLFGIKTNLERKKNKQKRIELEKERRQKREEEKETGKTTFSFGPNLPKLALPRVGFLDSIKRFLLYGLLGFAVDKIIPIIPSLLQFTTKLQPAFEFFKTVASGIVGGVVGFIDSSYKAYDFVKGKVAEIIGPDKTDEFNEFTKNLNTVLNGALLAATAVAITAISKKKGPLGKSGLDKGQVGLALGGAGAAALASRYTFRTVKDTAPAFKTRLSNMLLRGSMGLPAAKELPTRELLKRPEFAVAARKPKEIAKTIVVGADEVNTLRKAGVGTLTRPEQDEINSVKRKIGKRLGLTDRQVSNAFVFRDLYTPKPKAPKTKTVSSTQILGQTFSSEIARIKKSFMKLGYQPTDLIKIANDVDGQDYFTRKAAYDILVKKGKADRVFNVPTLEKILPRPANRVAKVAEPTTFEQYIRKMQESGRSVDPMLTGAAGDRAAQRAGVLSAEELVGGPPKVTRPTSDPTLSRTPSKLKRPPTTPLQFLRGAASRNIFKGLLGPIIGGVLDFLLSILFGEPLGLAAAGAIGATIGTAIGAGIGSLPPFVALGGPFIGGAIGGIGGDLFGRFLYETFTNRKQTDERLIKLAEFLNQDKKPGPAKPLLPKKDEQSYFGVKPVLTSRYGEMRGDRPHLGTDIAAPTGTPLVAVSNGNIIDYGDLSRNDTKRGEPGGWGNFIVYQDIRGLYHLYAHLNTITKKSGSVKQGEQIATVGNTGRSSGPHLHWEVGTGWTGSQMQGTMDPLSYYSVMSPFALKGGKRAANLASPNKNFASGLNDMTDYEQGGDVEIVVQPIVDKTLVPISASGGGDTVIALNSNAPSRIAPALIG